MPSVTYRGSFGGRLGSDGLTEKLTATQSVPSGAIITNVSYSLKISADNFSSSYDWIMNELAVGGQGGTPNANSTATMYDDEHTFSGNMGYYAADVRKFSGTSIDVYAEAYTTHPSRSYLWDVEITVDYAFPEKCTEPSTVTVNGSTGTVETNDTTVTLAWSGAKAGNANSIRAFLICSYDSTDGGNTWSNFQTVKEVATSATSGKTTVSLPAAGTRRKFTIKTCSSLGSVYDSEKAAESPAVYRKARPSQTAYTDSNIVAGSTNVKAVHMLELQSDINALRRYYGLADYAFTEIRAGYTSLAGWNGHINELRAAVDSITTNHETWYVLGDNKPRAEVIMQLRRVVAAL